MNYFKYHLKHSFKCVYQLASSKNEDISTRGVQVNLLIRARTEIKTFLDDKSLAYSKIFISILDINIPCDFPYITLRLPLAASCHPRVVLIIFILLKSPLRCRSLWRFDADNLFRGLYYCPQMKIWLSAILGVAPRFFYLLMSLTASETAIIFCFHRPLFIVLNTLRNVENTENKIREQIFQVPFSYFAVYVNRIF